MLLDLNNPLLTTVDVQNRAMDCLAVFADAAVEGVTSASMATIIEAPWVADADVKLRAYNNRLTEIQNICDRCPQSLLAKRVRLDDFFMGGGGSNTRGRFCQFPPEVGSTGSS